MLKDNFAKIEIVDEVGSIESAVRSVKAYNPDLVFLDIELPDGQGFHFLEQVEDLNFEVIFTTSHDNYAIKAFEFSAIDYIMKPIAIEALKSAVRKAEIRHNEKFTRQKLDTLIENLSNNNHKLTKIALPTGDGYNFVKIDHIISCEADSNYTHIFIKDEPRILVSRPLKELEQLLPDDTFFRIHKSYLINLNFIKKYVKTEGGYILMEDGRSLPLATRKREGFVDKLNRL